MFDQRSTAADQQSPETGPAVVDDDLANAIGRLVAAFGGGRLEPASERGRARPTAA